MLGSSGVLRLVKFAALLLIVVWCLGSFVSYESTYNGLVRTFKDGKHLFVSDFLAQEIDGDFDGRAISALCASKQWTPGLILSCDPTPGGIGQVRNAHLTCIRFAMEMGAELVVPRIVKRDEKDIAVLMPNVGGPQRGHPIDYLFKFEHLNQTLAACCPQMKVYRSMDDLYNVPQVMKGHPISLYDIHASLANGSVIDDMPSLGQQIKKYIDEVAPTDNRVYPIRFNLAVTKWAFQTAYDGPAFAGSFGRLLRAHEDARRLAAAALYNLSKGFGFNLDPRKGIKESTFVGAHLRTETDVDSLVPDYESQAAYLLDFIVNSRVRVVFLATGATEEQTTAFVARARDFNVTVVLKKDILHGDDLALLDRLSWDQRALVDYEIMLRAGLMAGPSESGYAWNLALRRRAISGGAPNNSSAFPVSSARVQYHDRLSTIFGRSERGSVFMQTIWP
ncbi:hypothetical protein B0T26DRAFT_633050 [Lasiosphaeria miniovina]|uniref:Alternative oxidase n=1 Tax=Lasiosphaeria miniovina TaxID=1954250 RepID=A0AA40ED63_9PEZI|nr:uncharacterized protein B0T26DRAFT_633050 [Lasiosphaeria miniovina]KAK0734002.1 hypothetical protein B0T26DRAFT_633050 [Lasiosphaeria miniovina]